MSHTPAYTVIQTPEADKLADIRDVSVNKDLPRDLLSGQVFPREALPWKNASAESYAENY